MAPKNIVGEVVDEFPDIPDETDDFIRAATQNDLFEVQEGNAQEEEEKRPETEKKMKMIMVMCGCEDVECHMHYSFKWIDTNDP